MADPVTPLPPAGGRVRLPPGHRDSRLPPLRDDLRLLPGPPAADGSPTWTLYDPAGHRFLRLGWLEFEILARWERGDPATIAAAVAAETPVAASPGDVTELVRFASRAGLLRPLGAESSHMLAEQARLGRLAPHRWLLKNYLFLRVPLVDPDRLLVAMLPWVEWAFRPWFPLVLAAAAAVGLTLVGRHWDAFTHGLSYAFSPEGALMTAVALSLAKVVHEFGHGLAARRYGCRVPAMGVGFLVMWPVLWTDVTDSWKLADRRQRMVIDAAGMAAEILLAVVASIVWSLLPDGPARSAVFLLAGSTWLMTLVVNLNPVMRFDGYFLLSDWLDIANLQERGFALGRWWLRETLFGLGAPPPEEMPLPRRRLVVGYALGVWVYRFFLFLGIALLVYHLAFKLLGLFLMSVEIWWFVARPILGELAAWQARRGQMRWNRRTMRTASVAALLVFAALVPWQGQVTAPALLRAGRQVALSTASSGRLVRMAGEGESLAAGQAAFVLESPDLADRRAEAIAMATGQRARLSGLSFDHDDGAGVEVGWQEFRRSVAEIEDIDAQMEHLVVRAPFAGTLVDRMAALRPGLWLGQHEPLGMLIDPNSVTVEAYVPEAEIERIRPGAAARFIPETDDAAVPLRVVSIDAASTRQMDVAALASVYGGPIAVRQDSTRQLVPQDSLYRVMLAPVGDRPPVRHARRGVVKIAADRSSLARSVWRWAAATVVRESGF